MKGSERAKPQNFLFDFLRKIWYNKKKYLFYRPARAAFTTLSPLIKILPQPKTLLKSRIWSSFPKNEELWGGSITYLREGQIDLFLISSYLLDSPKNFSVRNTVLAFTLYWIPYGGRSAKPGPGFRKKWPRGRGHFCQIKISLCWGRSEFGLARSGAGRHIFLVGPLG